MTLDANGARYLDLLKKVLTDYVRLERGETDLQPVLPKAGSMSPRHLVMRGLASALSRRGIRMYRSGERVDRDALLRSRAEGRDWPETAETMVGLKRLENVQACVEAVVADGVPGDLAETGAWRGGVTIFMRAVLAALGDPDRRVWVADSFKGLPKPDAMRWPADAGDDHHVYQDLRIGVDRVRDNFERFGLLDDRVRFLEGWFEDTLPDAPIERLAVLRLDGDMYGSTMVALEALYPKLSPGGYLIVDDYGAVPACRQAVEDYRRKQGIQEPIEQVDWTGSYWRRS